MLDNPHPYLVDILRQSSDFSRKSNGAFDVTVQPVWELWNRTHREHKQIDPQSLSNACRAVDWRRIEILDSQIKIHPRTEITLNGIAQGYAADRAAEALLTYGIKNALLDTGEISAFGHSKEDTSKEYTSTAGASKQWQVGIQHPRIDSAYVAIAGLDNRCLATSGDYESGFDEEHKNHHLLDPATGRSPSDVSSVSVVAPDATTADALSTAAFVMGLEDGSNFVRRTQGADALFVLKSGRVLKTDGFPLVTEGESRS